MRWRSGFLAGGLVLAGVLALPAVASAATVGESFSAPSVALSGTTTLTFTIAASDAVPPTVSFDDTLPAGLHIAGMPTTTCAAGVFLPGGTSDIVFTDAAVTDSTCTVSATVTGAQPGHWDDPVTVMVGAGSQNTDASLDVVAPPSISAAFGTSLLGLDGTTSLSFTITNPNSTFALSGLGFTDTLPAGLVIVGQPGAGNTCAGAVTAATGSDSVGLSGGQLSPGSSCTVSATVAATAIGAVSDSTTQVTSAEGGIGNTASAGLTVIGAPTVMLSSPIGGRRYPFGQTVRAAYTCVDVSGGPGIRTCTGSVANGAPIDTGQAGGHSFTVTATSLDGGVATDIVFYSVAPDNRFKLTKHRVHPGGAVDFKLKVPGPGRITVLETVAGSPLVFARDGAIARRAGSVRLTTRPTAKDRAAVKRQHNVRVIVTVGYTPTGGTQRTARLTLRVT